MNQEKSSTHEKIHGGEGAMMSQDQWSEIRFWSKLGKSIKTIARELSISRNTVRKALRETKSPEYHRQAKSPGVMDSFMAFVLRQAPEVLFNATTLFNELKEQGFCGAYSTVKLSVRPLREAFRQVEAATVRFETPPGEQAQMDWGSTWVQIAGQRVRLRIFVMVLGYSRTLYVEFTRDETLPSLIACHENAFRWFGGVTENILYDNPRTIVLDRGTDHARINPKFADFCRYYGYTPRLCRPYRAQTKGKVESGVKYVKRSFVPGRNATSLEDLNVQAAQWVRSVADLRIHGTVHEQPAQRFLREKLISIGHMPPYLLQTCLIRKVSSDCLISFEASRYSVPWNYVRQLVDVQAGDGWVRVYHQGALIAEHPRADRPFQLVTQRSHYSGLGKQREPITPLSVQHSSPQPDVQVRSLDVYEALMGGELHG